MEDLIGKPKINLKEQPTIACEKCENIYFKEVVLIKKVSKIMTGSPDDTLVPFPTYMCEKCGHVNDDFRLFDEDNKTNLV